MQRDQIKTNLSALFMPRQSSMNVDEAVSGVVAWWWWRGCGGLVMMAWWGFFP